MTDKIEVFVKFSEQFNESEIFNDEFYFNIFQKQWFSWIFLCFELQKRCFLQLPVFLVLDSISVNFCFFSVSRKICHSTVHQHQPLTSMTSVFNFWELLGMRNRKLAFEPLNFFSFDLRIMNWDSRHINLGTSLYFSFTYIYDARDFYTW